MALGRFDCRSRLAGEGGVSAQLWRLSDRIRQKAGSYKGCYGKSGHSRRL